MYTYAMKWLFKYFHTWNFFRKLIYKKLYISIEFVIILPHSVINYLIVFLCGFFNRVQWSNRQGRDTPTRLLKNMPSENDKKPVIERERKQKKRACNIEDQDSIQEWFLALQKEQTENQKTQKSVNTIFSKIFLANREKKGMSNEIKIQACNLGGDKRPPLP